MKYIYYIIAIVIIFSGLATYGMFDTRVKVSRPALSINDRVISNTEFEKMLLRKPSYMNQAQFTEMFIEKQLLIQEAIRMNIHKEENFRSSVENFYEQSLIKILLDRKLDSLIVDVTNDEIARYETMMKNKLLIAKMIYPSLEDAQNKINGTIEKIESDFSYLSNDLKFIVLNLEKGESSNPKSGDFGFIIYRLDDLQKINSAADQMKGFDVKKVSLFIQDKKKEQLLNEWIKEIRKSAEIWREK